MQLRNSRVGEQISFLFNQIQYKNIIFCAMAVALRFRIGYDRRRAYLRHDFQLRICNRISGHKRGRQFSFLDRTLFSDVQTNLIFWCNSSGNWNRYTVEIYLKYFKSHMLYFKLKVNVSNTTQQIIQLLMLKMMPNYIQVQVK